MRTPDVADWQEGCAHDPSVVEYGGKHYAFSTDIYGAPCGNQIRVSEDLLHWEYLTTAFRMEGTAEDYRKGKGEFQQAYDWCVTSPKEAKVGVCTRPDGTMAFWAPHCVRAKNGEYRLYFCLTGYFGGSKSCIGLAVSTSPEQPFRFVGLIVRSPAGWRTPNAIDPQFFEGEGGRQFLVYGSFGMGLFLVELDPATGLRLDGNTYEDYCARRCSFHDYYGKNLAVGSLEGGAIRYHAGVDVLEGGKWVKKNYYYLTCSYGSLSSAYQIRCARSERPEGPYVDVNGNTLVCSTDLGTGNKLFGSFGRQGEPDYFCPGHNDLYVTDRGVRLVAYHCRTNYFIEKKLSTSSNFHYLYLNQYDFNADGWLVMNPNRYAGEEIQEIGRQELLGVSAGKFRAVLFTQSFAPTNERRMELNEDGTLGGEFRGRWRMFGSHYAEIEADGETYSGVVMPAWIAGERRAGLALSLLGKTSGMALLMNSAAK